MFDICTDVHFDSVCTAAYSGHFCFGGDLTKPSITIASVDRFVLKFGNLFAIRHCIVGPEFCKNLTLFVGAMTMYTGGTFFLDTVYIRPLADNSSTT